MNIPFFNPTIPPVFLLMRMRERKREIRIKPIKPIVKIRRKK